MSREVEEWRSVVGYEGLYEVSDHGRVRSLDRWGRTKHNSIRIYRGRVLKPCFIRDHEIVSLHDDGVSRIAYIHRLVLEAFVGPCPPGMVCRHFPDRNPHNNNLNNIQWGTQSENAHDSIVHGTNRRGELNGRAKLTDDDVREMRRLHHERGVKIAHLAAKYGLGWATVRDVVRYKHWRHVS